MNYFDFGVAPRGQSPLALWFEDVTPGKKAFKLNSVKAGAVLNVVEVGEKIAVNGENLPSTAAGEELRVHWEVEETDKSGDIPAAKMTSDVGRADIAADAIAELASEEYDGRKIVFTVRGNFSSAKIAALLKYVAPPEKRRVEVSGFTAHAMGENTIVEFDLENAEDLAGYEAQDEGATAPASFKADGEPIEGDAIETFGPGEKWHAVLPENHSGKTIEMTLTPDPAKADEVDQTPVVESAAVEG